MSHHATNPALDEIISEYLRQTRRTEHHEREQLLNRHPELAEQLSAFFAEHDRAESQRYASTLPLGQSTREEQAACPELRPAVVARDCLELSAAAHDSQEIEDHVERPLDLGTAAASPKRVSDRPTLAPHDLPTLAPNANPTGTIESTAAARLEDCGEQSRCRFFGDYELLEEIARGGMGVVYRARQVSLNRVVALKMILAGQLAGPADVQRFHAEAEAAANLDHPGIVPIHEVGEHEGQHYFSMGFVQGVSLDEKVKSGPLPARQAALYAKKIADAMAYAHARGVIHRDLKPANVLLDQADEPKVTDFGLAKKLEGDSGLTASGQILGTPSYMPPEQASGKIAEVTETADVYSLGAILYCLVTGRPPFQADSHLDTLLQVLESDPATPKALNRHVPQELSLICLRCLEKAPAARYPSASALAEDLDRFLTGEPVVAQTSSTLHQLIRWARQNPALASRWAGLFLIATIIVVLFFFVGTTGIFVIQSLVVLSTWAMLSFVFQRMVRVERRAEIARLAWVSIEPVLATTLLYLAANNHEEPIGPVLVVYPLLITASGLFSRVRLVLYVTVASTVSYLSLLMLQPDEASPFYFAIYFIAFLTVLGGIVAYQVRRMNALCGYYQGHRG